MDKFKHVDTWLFDLDNTLYDASTGVFDRIIDRMNLFVSGHLQISTEQASALRKTYWERYGTTLRGMMEEHGTNPDNFLWYAHDIDISDVPQCAITKEFLAHLPGRKIVYTNSSHEFAERMMKHLGIHHHFEDIFSIEDTKYVPKPEIDAYHALIRNYNFDPKRATMFEDMQINLKTAADLGMTTVWIHGKNKDAETHALPHLHHKTETLAKWLEQTVPQHPHKKDK
jgi:putative hydrolase of the HAD superfamily